MEKRISYWQALRGVCILCVIMAHGPNALEYGLDTIEYWFYIAMRAVRSFAVPLFFCMAGFFINREKILACPLKWSCSRAISLLLPYGFWSLLIILSRIHRGNLEWKDFTINMLYGYAMPQLYFIIVLVQLTFLTPLLLKFIGKRLII